MKFPQSGLASVFPHRVSVKFPQICFRCLNPADTTVSIGALDVAPRHGSSIITLPESASIRVPICERCARASHKARESADQAFLVALGLLIVVAVIAGICGYHISRLVFVGIPALLFILFICYRRFFGRGAKDLPAHYIILARVEDDSIEFLVDNEQYAQELAALNNGTMARSR